MTEFLGVLGEWLAEHHPMAGRWGIQMQGPSLRVTYMPASVDPVQEAASRGHDAGSAAGSWVIDGNTTRETALHILRGYEDGDPEIMDMMPAPLSGEWAGESITELLGDLLATAPRIDHHASGVSYCNDCQTRLVLMSDEDDEGNAYADVHTCQESSEPLLDAYEEAFSESYWETVIRAAKYVVNDLRPTDPDPALNPANYAMRVIEVPYCLPCDDDEHHGCYGALCECPCKGEEVR